MIEKKNNNKDSELKAKMEAAKIRAKKAAEEAKLIAKKARDSDDENIDKADKYINKVDMTNDFIMEGRDPNDCY